MYDDLYDTNFSTLGGFTERGMKMLARVEYLYNLDWSQHTWQLQDIQDHNRNVFANNLQAHYEKEVDYCKKVLNTV